MTEDMQTCDNCKEEEEKMYCITCYTFSPTCCEKCGYCLNCERIYSSYSLSDWRGR